MKNFVIEEGTHPILPHIKITWLRWDEEHSNSRINLKYAEDTIKRYYLGKEFDMFDYCWAMDLIRSWKKSKREKKTRLLKKSIHVYNSR